MFTEIEFKKIQGAVAEAEANTSGEIVVYFTDRSGGYRWIPWACALLGCLCAGLVLWLGSWWGAWQSAPLRLLEAQALAAAAFFALSSWRPIQRRLVPRSTLHHRVHREALARFVLSGVGSTQDHTGILIFLSDFERSVEIVADSAIHEACGTQYWSAQTASIAAGIHGGRSVEAVCEAVGEMGRRLADRFPRERDDENELPDGPASGKFTDNSDS